MYKFICSFFLFIFSSQINAIADSDKAVYNVFIDTDGSLDDFRAINMFLAGKDFSIRGIGCSQGTLRPEDCFQKVTSLLNTYYHEGIPVGLGENTGAKLPAWSAFAEGVHWGSRSGQISGNGAFDILERTVFDSKEKVSLVALGSLFTFAHWIKNTKQDYKKIEKIVWYCEPDFESEFNYLLDKSAYHEVLRSKIPLVVISKGKRSLLADQRYIRQLESLNIVYAKRTVEVMNSKPVLEKVRQGHAQLWDDLVPLYLSHPDLFTPIQKAGYLNVIVKQEISDATIFADIVQIFNSRNEAMNRVFTSFPLQSSLYKNDYAGIVKLTVDNYGLAEWKSIVLTNEVHGHTGIYSIIGAKAGIRACEYFNVDVNKLSVVSYAGNTPPLSCFNDGIQISTGATIGQGLIKIANEVLPIPTVDFDYDGKKIKLILKKEVAKKMQTDIQTGIQKYGMTSDYWKYIENLAKVYWTDLDRHDIFNITLL